MKTIVNFTFLGPKGTKMILHHFVKQIGSNRKKIWDLNTLGDKSYISRSKALQMC